MIALYAGTFDPPHRGHLDLIRRAAALVDELIVGIAVNPDKREWLPVDIRTQLLRADIADRRIAHVRLVHYAEATVLYARTHSIDVLVRGIRTTSDLEAEQTMAMINRANGFETLFLLTDGALAHISSRAVRIAHGAGLPIADLVGERVAAAVAQRTPVP